MSISRENIHILSEIRVAVFTGGVRIFIGSSEIAMCAPKQYKFGRNSPQRL